MGSWLLTPSDSSSGAPGAELPEKQTQMERSGLRAEFSAPQCLERPARETKRNGQHVRRRSKRVRRPRIQGRSFLKEPPAVPRPSERKAEDCCSQATMLRAVLTERCVRKPGYLDPKELCWDGERNGAARQRCGYRKCFLLFKVG